MNNWSIEADTIKMKSDWSEIPFYINKRLKDFIELSDKFFIVAPKGLGKTLMIKAKSNFYRQKNKASYFYPKNELCEKIGAGINAGNFSIEEINKFKEISQWEIIWELSLSLIIFKTLKIEIPEEITTIIGDANSISDIVNILLSERGTIYKLQSSLPKYVRPKLREIENSIALFIDNIDEAFVSHDVDDLQKLDDLSVVWRNVHLAFIDVVKRIVLNNRHIKIFASIRAEAFDSSQSSTYLQTQEYGIRIRYTREELKEIFIENIKMTDSKNKFIDEDEIKSFFGFNEIEHVFVKKGASLSNEDIFMYMLRHTFDRPREIVEIGKAINEIKPQDRSLKKIRETIHECSYKLLEQYKREVIPYFDEEKYNLLKAIIQTNIIERNDLSIISSNLNMLENETLSVFQYFFNLGLIGFVEKRNGEELYQRFYYVSEFSNLHNRNLPDSNFYLLHPSLEEDLKQFNFHFFHNKFTIVGNGYSFPKINNHNNSKVNIHFGAGRIGLGLVLPVFKDLGRFIIIQRPNERWNLIKSENVVIKVNEEELCHISFVECESKEINTIKKIIDNEHYILLLTDSKEIIKYALSKATSITTSLGPSGVRELPSKISDIIPTKPLLLFPFENDINAVEEMTLKLDNKEVLVPNVSVDRICSNVILNNNIINVETEEYYQVIINCINGSIYDLFKNKKQKIILARKEDEFNFYKNRKLWLVNGIHMIMALMGYQVLLDKKIKEENWKNYSINIFTEIAYIKRSIEIFSDIQIIRLLLTYNESLKYIYPTKTQREIYDSLKEYSFNVWHRFASSPDFVERILNLHNQEAVKRKYEERITAINKFLSSNLSNIKDQLQRININQNQVEFYLIEMSNLFEIIGRILLNKKNAT